MSKNIEQYGGDFLGTIIIFFLALALGIIITIIYCYLNDCNSSVTGILKDAIKDNYISEIKEGAADSAILYRYEEL